jgi:hypothetical protein
MKYLKDFIVLFKIENKSKYVRYFLTVFLVLILEHVLFDRSNQELFYHHLISYFFQIENCKLH